MKYKFRRRLIYILTRFLGFFLFLLPVKIAVSLGGLLGVTAFFLLRRQRLQAIDNLLLAFGSQKSRKEIYVIAKDVFKNFGKSAAEFANFSKINNSNIDKFVKVCGIEKINKALQAKKGIIVLSSHLGNWELSAAYFALKGYHCSVIVRPLRYEKYDKLVNNIRHSKNINTIPRDDSFKKLLSALKKNHIVGILPDQDIDNVSGVFINFFDTAAYTPTGPVVLAMASGAPVFPVFCIRQYDDTHKIIIEDQIKLEITGSRQKDILVSTQKWSSIIEAYIRTYPSQWAWIHKRWKTQGEK